MYNASNNGSRWKRFVLTVNLKSLEMMSLKFQIILFYLLFVVFKIFKYEVSKF
jgi:hypothetical protein